MKKTALLEIIADQSKKKLSKNTILREQFQILSQDKFIRIFSGIRRCGKSTLLQYIRENNKEKDYYINFDDERLINFSLEDFQQLKEIFMEQFGEQNTFYFDEIQNIPKWERFIRRLHDEGAKIYITGSNAQLLSKELGTHLTGRYIKTELYPFSFREYLKHKQHPEFNINYLSTSQKVQLKKAFKNYIKQGGFPEFLETNNAEYLRQLYENIIYRDIVVRYKLPNAGILKELGLYCASNIGKPLSYNKLKEMLGAGSATTIKEYLEYFENSYLFFQINKFNYSVKKQIYSTKKVYPIDNGLAGEVGFHFSQEKGRYLENAIFLELKRQGKNIFYHQNKRECDFVIKDRQKITEAIQVSSNMDNNETHQREVEGLLEAMEEFELKKGLILTTDEDSEETFKINGKKASITILPAWKWLLRNP